MKWVFIIVGVSILLNVIYRVYSAFKEAKLYRQLKPELDSLNVEKERFAKDKANTFEHIEKITRQRSMGFPWLAEAYADYFALKDGKLEKYLKYKSHPAYTAAEVVREIKKEKKELVKENKILSYKILYFIKLFPWLEDLIALDESDYIPVEVGMTEKENEEDSVQKLLTQHEYQALPSVERNQLALDRYLKSRNKSKWAIGRDYEMYVGYLYGSKGYTIEYKGIIDGYEDMGRDIIAKNKDEILIIQCKHWAQYKNIHEKHIFQLFGSTMEYWIQHFKGIRNTFNEFSKLLNDQTLRPIFFTSTTLSDTAKKMASALSVEVIEDHPLGDFPRIKCNVNTNEFGRQSKIYHLPMDQQYDSTVIGNRADEFYAFTVKEAEEAGFRRAFRHRFGGNK